MGYENVNGFRVKKKNYPHSYNLRYYSKNTRDAWLVIDKIKRDHSIDIRRSIKTRNWLVTFSIDDDSYFSKDTILPRAICKAALMAKGVEI